MYIHIHTHVCMPICVYMCVCIHQFSHSVVSDSLWPHGLQHARPPCPSPTPGVCSNSCPSSRWCHPTVSSGVVPFFSCLQSFPASGSFPMSWFFASGGWRTGVSASASVLPMNIQDWFRHFFLWFILWLKSFLVKAGQGHDWDWGVCRGKDHTVLLRFMASWRSGWSCVSGGWGVGGCPVVVVVVD